MQLHLFEYWEAQDSDFIEERYVCWKMLANVALATELVLCEDVRDGWEYRVIPLVI